MENTTLIKLLKTFSAKEMKEFNHFVNSPYFNREKVLVRFSEILGESFPDFLISKEKVFEKIYPGKKFKDNLFRNIQSDLLKLAEEYLAVNNFRSGKTGIKKNLFEQLIKRNLSSHYLKQNKTLSEQMDNVIIRDGNYFFDKYDLEMKHESYLDMNIDDYLRDERHDLLLENLTIFFFINFFRHSSSSINKKKFFQDSGNFTTAENEIEKLLTGKYRHLLEIPYIKLNYYLYKLLKDESEEYFLLLRNFVEENPSLINEMDRMNVMTALFNFSYMKVLSGDLKYQKILFGISLSSIKSRFYKNTKGFLPHVKLMNAVVTGLEANETDEAGKLIKEFSEDLLPEFKEPTLHFCNALVHFKMKQYDDAIRELSVVDTEDFSFKQQIKSLYLKIYFDLNESEPFYFHIDNYRHFINKNKIIHVNARTQLKSYLEYTKKLFDIKNTTEKKNSVSLRIIEDEILKNNSLINRKWLLEKIGEMKSYVHTK